eukprot:m.160981 g.160981  ORF g.160981 m.160981 type:complete len:144 (+) comp16515_c0_seq5:2204-2635(+)
MSNPALGSWLATEMAVAMQLHQAKKIDIIPICVGAMLKLQHPSKPHKTFDVFDSFDRVTAEDISDHLVRGIDEAITVRQVVNYYLQLHDESYFLHPFDDQLDVPCDQIVAWFIAEHPDIVDTTVIRLLITQTVELMLRVAVGP